MKNLFFIFFALFTSVAFAQTATTDTQALSTAQTGNIGNIGNSYNMAPGYVEQNFKTNQAGTPGTIVGSAASANGGCPAVDGWNAGVVVANGSVMTAKELPGCMINQFKDRIAGYEKVETVKGSGLYVWTWQTKLKLEADCAYPLYRDILETSGVYECNATVKARQAQGTAPVAATSTRDPYIAASGRQYPSVK